jgi:hypothetical protein
MPEIHRESREYVWVPIQVTWGDLTDITIVEVALTSDLLTRPLAGDWVAATLVGPAHLMGDGTNTYIRTLLGPGGDASAELTHAGVGDYQLWERITSAPELIVLAEGTVTVL